MTENTTGRRRFLKLSLLTPAIVATGSMRLARAGELDGIDVIVIGAGCAGLGAARTLADSGATVTVIEAKPNIGGRLLTDWSMGAPFEVGAGWIHGPEPANPTRKLADAVGAKYFVTEDDNLVLFDVDGEEVSEDDLEEIDDDWSDAIERLDDQLEDDDSRRSLRDVLSRKLSDESFEWAMSAYTEFSAGGPLEKLSAVLHDDGKAFDDPDAVVTTGYDELLKPLAAGLDIKLSTVVSAIEYSTDGATIKTNNGNFDADYVVCSVPLGVLKNNSIEFDPPLPRNYRNNINKIGFGSVTKIALKFDEAFWDVETQYFGMMNKPRGRWNYWLNYRTFSNENILLGLCVGDYALTADKMSDAELKADALNALRNVWEEDVGDPIQMLRTSWLTDEYSLGAYAYPTPGLRANHFNDLRKPVEDRLLLCGEHTNFNYLATTHGAYMSGLRAAKYILKEET